VKQRLSRFRASGPPEERPLEDGRWVSVQDYKTRDGGIFVIQTDITERKHAEEALKENEERLKAIIDSIPAMVNVKDKDRRYLMTNRTHHKFFGYDPEDVIGHARSVVTGLDAKRILEIEKRVLEAGETVTYDARRTDAGEQQRDLLATKAPLRDSTGEIVGIVTSSIDITERKQAEEALRENEERLQLILENAVSGVITIDEKGVIGTFNTAAENIFSYSAEEAIGKNVSMLMPDPDHSAHDGYLENYRNTGKAEIIGIGREVEGLRKNGATFPMQLEISELTLGGKRVFTGFVEDISERKQAEEALLESEERFRDLARNRRQENAGRPAGSLARAFRGYRGEAAVQQLHPFQLGQPRRPIRRQTLFHPPSRPTPFRRRWRIPGLSRHRHRHHVADRGRKRNPEGPRRA
jgi:PAS domain S-box-containing protein